MAPGLNLDGLLTGRGNPTVRVRGSESNFWEHIKASKTEYTKRPKQCLGGILRFVGNPCEIVMCDMLCALFDVTYIYINTYVAGPQNVRPRSIPWIHKRSIAPIHTHDHTSPRDLIHPLNPYPAMKSCTFTKTTLDTFSVGPDQTSYNRGTIHTCF